MELVNKIDEKELYAARSVADAAGNNIVDTYAQKTEIPDVSNLATKDEISDMATEQWVQDQGYLTEHQSLEGLMAEDKLTIEDGKITQYDGTPFAGGGESDIVVFNDSNLPTSTQLDEAIASNKAICVIYEGRTYMFDRQSGTTYYFYGADGWSSYLYSLTYNGTRWSRTQQVLAKQSWVNSQGFAKASDIPSVDGLMDESKLTIEDGKITEYDGTPFAGQGGEGGKTYEGVAPIIVDNEANTISADTIDVNYQQITHDDSLVHVSNNAQYALGVNIDYLKQIMGVDETVLWEGSSNMKDTPAFNLSESFKNFKYIEIFGKAYPTHAETSYLKFNSVTLVEGVTLYMPYKGGGSILRFGVAFLESSSDTVLNIQTGSAFQITIQSGSSSTANANAVITKIVGIGRKGGN